MSTTSVLRAPRVRLPRMTPPRRTLLAAAYTVVVFAACSIPGHSLPESLLLSADKAWHVGAFALYAVLWRRARRPALRVLALGLAFGLAIEVWQHLAPLGRYFDGYDVLADAAGLLLGLGLDGAARRLFRGA